MKNINKLLLYRKKFIDPYIQKLLKLVNGITYIMAVLFIVGQIFEHGFNISDEEQIIINMIYQVTWCSFILNSLLNIIFNFSEVKVGYRKMMWLLNFLLFITIIPKLIPEPRVIDSSFHGVWEVANSQMLIYILLASLSLLKLSTGAVLLLSKRVSPSFIFSGSFLLLIFMGAGLLMLPRSTYEGISFTDALFMSTSATCVTGLATVDVASTFTTMGQLFIMLLIQIGGLGVMTLTSFFTVFFMGNTSIHNQAMMSDMVSSKSLNSLLTTLLYILGFTLIIELGGAVLIFFNITDTLGMTIDEEIFFAIFHSISAFCNAGFSTLTGNLGNEMLLSNHNIFYLVISALVIFGSIGFPILVNFYEMIKHNIIVFKERYIMRRKTTHRNKHLINLNTRIVVNMTLFLLIASTATIALLEWNVAFRDMPVWDKIVQAFFTATCPRTAGFGSVSMGSFTLQTLLLMILLMIIGGGAQSTAGGIKVNVFAVLLANIRAIFRGEDKVSVFGRELSNDSIQRSNNTFVIYLIFISFSLFLLSIFEPDADLLALIFECISALSTVGSSLDLTSTLGNDSKFVIIALMFIGRIGVLTIVTGIIANSKKGKYKYPSGQIIIN